MTTEQELLERLDRCVKMINKAIERWDIASCLLVETELNEIEQQARELLKTVLQNNKT